MHSIQDKMASAGGKPTGFDFLRIGLSVMILVFHSSIITGGASAQSALLNSWLGPVCNTFLPLFFSLSGFLVTASLLRTPSLRHFLGLRALRIFPALTVDTLFCALVIGAAFTSLGLRDYYSSAQFGAYFMNVFGHIHYHLPGVFEHNPTSKVNGQLWTIPYELECYIALACLAALGLTRRKTIFTAGLLAACIGTAVLLNFSAHYDPEGGRSILSGRSLVLCFLLGAACHLHAHRIPHSQRIFCVSLLLLLLCTSHRELTYLIPIPCAYVAAYLGTTNVTKPSFLQGSDYSYGIFLYSYPLQQAVQTVLPASTWWANAILAFPPTLLLAYLSWHLIEKRCLTLRRYLR